MKYSSVTDLELKGNNIGSAGLSALANAVRQSYTLKSLSLEWNNAGAAD
jgi:hypothetical protein